MQLIKIQQYLNILFKLLNYSTTRFDNYFRLELQTKLEQATRALETSEASHTNME